jgi:hypothetical protein
MDDHKPERQGAEESTSMRPSIERMQPYVARHGSNVIHDIEFTHHVIETRVSSKWHGNEPIDDRVVPLPARGTTIAI